MITYLINSLSFLLSLSLTPMLSSFLSFFSFSSFRLPLSGVRPLSSVPLVSLEINGLPVQVPAGSTVLQACEVIGL